MEQRGEKPVDYRSLSRTIAHALRHQPGRYGLELDEEGWVPVADLLRALRQQRASWRDLREEDLETMMASAGKQRYELRAGKIRALYGHSLPRRLPKPEAIPPEILYHGTVPEALPAIQREGLKPMRRQYVHLSTDTTTARQVGGRRTRRPVVLMVRARAASEQGVRFYRGNDQTWLADAVPPAFIDFPSTKVDPDPVS
ncbi:RNA 2'-phosphotransferase [Thermogemmatispora carboxidivorans]|uniref:RNA 2'-phosphotransferase n=1 Tax=Thermogemmatispora carboxidivorans TaxID=1382306 RepID=UPI00069BCBE2|nr:RNA 2'-phosphotransferase [Thermogemmatispora carboxidivorans]